MRNPQRSLRSVPLGFVNPCRPTAAKQPPSGVGWVHEVEHDGYRIQIHVRDGRVRLYTMNGHDWTERYPRAVEEAGRISCQAVIDAELVCLDVDGKANFDNLHSRCFDEQAIACGFDLLRHNGDDLRRSPLADRKTALRKMLTRGKGGIQYVEHVEGEGAELFEHACKLGLEGIVSKRLTGPYKSGPCKSWIKARNPKSPAFLRITDGSTG